jgi:hypothetical protein
VVNNTPRATRNKPLPRRRRRRPSVSSEDAFRSVEALRRAIVGPDRERIERLETATLDASDVARVLPEAIARASRDEEDEQKLGIALEPTVTSAVTAVARKQPELYADILAPTIGAAVTKAVGDAIAAMLERFNEALERSLSVRSLKWRIEARRTGRPFAEVVLLHTLRYRIEQVFLIHTRTSLVLQHLVDPSLDAPAADQVAAMLSAIDAFGQEAFAMSPGAHLDRFALGDLTVLMIRADSVGLAAVVRGTPAAEIKGQLEEALARVRLELQIELQTFAGDVSRFAGARPMLEPLLKMERRPPPRRAHIILLALLLGITIALLAGGTWLHSRRTAEAARHAAYLRALESEPGMIVDRDAVRHGRIEGLRDPLAATPASVLARNGLAPLPGELVSFVSLDPAIVERRAEQVLSPPPSVNLSMEGRTLWIAGTAPAAWIDETRVVRRTLPGIERFDDHALRPEESLDALRAAAYELESHPITFEVRHARIGPLQKPAIERAARQIREALYVAKDARIGVCVTVTGHADPTGSDEENTWLSDVRASAVRERLALLGADGGHLRIVGAGALVPPRTPSVSLRLETDESRPDCEAAR